MSTNDVIQLNVGGKIFETYRSTLLSAPGSLISKMFDPDSNLPAAKSLENGVYFIDCCPQIFGIILNYFRFKSIIGNPGVSLASIREVAIYFNIQELADHIDAKLKEIDERSKAEQPTKARKVTSTEVRTTSPSEQMRAMIAQATPNINRESNLRQSLEQYQARRLLAGCSGEGGEAGQKNESGLYMEAVTKFIQAQRERQQANLATNMGKAENAADAQRVMTDHDSAVSWMLTEPLRPLSKGKICELHRLVCFAQPHAGEYRTKDVQCGKSVFTSFQKIESEMEVFLSLANNLLKNEQNLDVISVAAAIMIGFFDIHPFQDGNGRVGRLLVNWVLLVHGVPFLCGLCGSQTQRQSYIQAIKASLTQISLEPVAKLIAKVVEHAWAELDRTAQSVLKTAAEDARDERVREERGEAVKRDCMICLGEVPNIATLCCGAPVHLNCLAQWFANGDEPKCVHCRSPFPQLSDRLRSPQANGDETSEIGDNTTSVEIDDETETREETTEVIPNPNTCAFSSNGCGNNMEENCFLEACRPCCNNLLPQTDVACPRHPIPSPTQSSSAGNPIPSPTHSSSAGSPILSLTHSSSAMSPIHSSSAGSPILSPTHSSSAGSPIHSSSAGSPILTLTHSSSAGSPIHSSSAGSPNLSPTHSSSAGSPILSPTHSSSAGSPIPPASVSSKDETTDQTTEVEMYPAGSHKPLATASSEDEMTDQTTEIEMSEAETADTTTEDGAQQMVVHCLAQPYCHNHVVRGCSNSSCDGCCHLFGSQACVRHRNFNTASDN